MLFRSTVYRNGESRCGGTGREPVELCILELSDAFVAEEGKGMEPDIEVRVRMLNINYGKNRKLLEACRPLGEYAWLIQRIREHSVEMGIEEAVDHAIEEMPEGYEIREFLLGHKAEVRHMCITEYNEAETMQMLKEEGRREGHREGLAESRKEIAQSMLNANEPIEKIVRYTGMEKEDVEDLAASL